MKNPVTLQISLAPSDFRHARQLLPHQIRTWRDQVSEILLTVDLHRSAGRFSTHWEEGRKQIFELARSIEGAQVIEVDYGAAAMQRVANEFFGGNAPVPVKDFRGGPYFSYFFALSQATFDHVLHLDSDMLFGGGSSSWLEEALADQSTDAKVLFSAPLPGPPTEDGQLCSQEASRLSGKPHIHDFDTMSTRLFLLSRNRFSQKIGALHQRRPSVRSVIKATIEKNPRADLPEHLFSAAMQEHGLIRREFLGTSAGMWHLHPPYRCADFFSKLPSLVNRCETDQLPAEQRGYHDINESLVDWSEARTRLRGNRWWRRLLKR